MRFFCTRESFLNELVAAGKAALFGTEAFPKGKAPGLFTFITGWVSEIVPFASDIRNIGLEIWKSQTGCDHVNEMNLISSVVGLTLDVATFGIGGRIKKASELSSAFLKKGNRMKNLLKAMKPLVKQSVIVGATAHAIQQSIIYTTCLIEKAEDDKLPDDHWSLNILDYFESTLGPAVNALGTASAETKERFNAAINSFDDMIDMVELNSYFINPLVD